MTFEDLQIANGLIKTTNIKGKEYAEVNQRVKAFRSLYPEGTIKTELLKFEEGVVITQTTIYNERGEILSTGLAYEREGSSNINRTSCLENCETSSTGRALGFLGLGIDTSIASYEEVTNARLQQEGLKLASKNEKEGLMATIEAMAPKMNLKPDELTEIVLEYIGFDRSKQPEGMTIEQYGRAMNYLTRKEA